MKRKQRRSSIRSKKKTKSSKHTSIKKSIKETKGKRRKIPNFDCGVAVWLQELPDMSFEDTTFLNYEAKEHGCVSSTTALVSGTKHKGMKFFFPDVNTASAFCSKIPETSSPLGGYPYKSIVMGSFLRAVYDVEKDLEENREKPKIIVGNLKANKRVSNRVIELCQTFGKVLHQEMFNDLGEHFTFHHLVVAYDTATEAFAACMGLDGKWISEQDYPLSVEILVDETVKNIKKELFKMNKMIFQP